MSVVPLVTNCVLHKKTPSKGGGKLPVTGEEENPEESQGEIISGSTVEGFSR
jgi:hypothetical protein